MRGNIDIIFLRFKFGDDPISSLFFSFIGLVVFDGILVAVDWVDWVYVAKTSPSPGLRIPVSLIEFNFCSVAMLRTPPLYSVLTPSHQTYNIITQSKPPNNVQYPYS